MQKYGQERDKQKQEFKLRIYRYIIRLIQFLSRLPNEPVIREIKSQATRSGTSIGANYFEAEAASSKKDYQNFFHHALKSANETKFWLAILRDGGLIPSDLKNECDCLLQETKELSNILAASLITMKGKRK
ncbi:four helix bundle protein [Candidatus Parcubacteria bacterium]|nr:four helix bundle protein [Patescibacteria group bacterium]MCG2694296.1 four helix bundle protein [Candidatus Parcubacteria bacterium]